MNLPTLEYDLFTADGKRGWIGTWHSHLGDDSMTPIEEPIADRFIDETRIFISTSTPKGITKRWTLKLRGYLKKDYDCKFEFGLTAAGRAKVSSFFGFFVHRSHYLFVSSYTWMVT